MSDNAPATQNGNLPALAALPGELSVEQMLAQVEKIQQLMKLVMKRDEHYGIIPGTPKPTLLKPGAEKLCLAFRLDPQYSAIEQRDGEHLTITSTCILYHIGSGTRLGSGMGSCSTRESKYAYRKSARTCPECGSEALFKDKKGPGYYCWSKKGGCGFQFKAPEAIQQIEAQDTGRVANPDIADQYNTVLKMANKRSLVAAVLNVTAASDIFTQDLEDLKAKREAMEPYEQELDDHRQKPTDRISIEQWTAIQKAAQRQLGPESKLWLQARLEAAGCQRPADLTVEGLQKITVELAERAAADQRTDPADSFDESQRQPGDEG